MGAKAMKNSVDLGNKIKARRNELNMTIEEAAKKANVGTKTWCRYEAGESIRHDKVSGVYRALNWLSLPTETSTDDFEKFNLSEYTSRDIWPAALAEEFGNAAAVSFVIGSDILLDHIQETLEELSHKPKGTHLGELDFSPLDGIFPPQFLMEYNYDFLYYFKSVIEHYRQIAHQTDRFVAHSVAEELALYLIKEESECLMEIYLPSLEEEEDFDDVWEDWPFELFDDMDIVTCLYSGSYIDENHVYHFKHWKDNSMFSDCTP